MLQGLRTAMYHVGDLDAAKKWYANVLGFEPYFDEPFYVGFSVGGYELGLNPDDVGAKGGSTYVYWGVANIETAYQRLRELGAQTHEEINDVGDGIQTATVTDPWGNIFGIINNPHFKLEDAR